ncbi:hypothetical protein [Xenorhabdus cabanillasii]|nr:hypothetical protein [Xenorhabdus cabanillasii]
MTIGRLSKIPLMNEEHLLGIAGSFIAVSDVKLSGTGVSGIGIG